MQSISRTIIHFSLPGVGKTVTERLQTYNTQKYGKISGLGPFASKNKAYHEINTIIYAVVHLTYIC